MNSVHFDKEIGAKTKSKSASFNYYRTALFLLVSTPISFKAASCFYLSKSPDILTLPPLYIGWKGSGVRLAWWGIAPSRYNAQPFFQLSTFNFKL